MINDNSSTAPDPGAELDARLAARLAALSAPAGDAEAAARAERERIRQLAIETHAVTVSQTGRMMPFEELLRHSPEENAELLLRVVAPARAAPCGCLHDFEHGRQCGAPAPAPEAATPPGALAGDLAPVMYDAACLSLSGRTPWPPGIPWAELGDDWREAWEAGVQAALDRLVAARDDVPFLVGEVTSLRAEMAEVRRIAYQGGQDAASVRRELLTYLEANGGYRGDGPARPPVVCLCGSTRFYDEFRRANLRLTLAGEIVLSIGCDTKSDGDLAATAELGTDPATVKARLDELHRRKIDLCDYVLVLNVGGYIGESTRSEIDYATAHGKPVHYLEARNG